MGASCSSARPGLDGRGGRRADARRVRSTLRPQTSRSARSHSSRSSRKRERWQEKSRLVGNMMRTNVSLRIEDEYDCGSARVLGSGMSGEVLALKHLGTGRYALKTPTSTRWASGWTRCGSRSTRCGGWTTRTSSKSEIFEDRASQQIHLVMSSDRRRARRGGRGRRDGMAELAVARLVMKMLSALSHCHEQDVMHRDIKLENFVYDTKGDAAELKLIDFGLSHLGRPRAEKPPRARVGTLSYMAPRW